MGLHYFTLIHVLISLVGIVSGFGALAGMLAGLHFRRWTAVFLGFTVLTSVTGFFFPLRGFTPAVAVGILSLLDLALCLYALYIRKGAGIWRAVYVVSAVMALYLNFFVLIAQFFQKIPVFQELAPTQSEPPFAITQGIVLIAFVLLGIYATLRFRPPVGNGPLSA